MSPLAVFTSLLLLSSLTHALDLIGKVQWNHVCSAFADIHPAKVVLDNGIFSANIRKDGHFTIPDVPSGTFLLSVLSHDFRFDQLRIDILDVDRSPTVHPYIPGTPLSPASPVSLPYPLALSARSKNTYFVEPEAFSVIPMFQSPMMLLMIGTAVLMFAMPYLMANMDPETRNQVKETQQQMLSAQNSIQNLDMGGLQRNLLRTQSEGATNNSNSTPPSRPTPAGSSKGKSKGRKR